VQVDEYVEAASRRSAAPIRLPEPAWRKYAKRMREFSAQYRKQIDDHVTATMRQWRARVGPLADNDWLTFAVKLFDIRTRQGATRNDTPRSWIDFELANFLQLIDVDGLLAWNATVIQRWVGQTAGDLCTCKMLDIIIQQQQQQQQAIVNFALFHTLHG